jgi:hypothetical protein
MTAPRRRLVHDARVTESGFDLAFRKGRAGEMLVGDYVEGIAAGDIEVKRKSLIDLVFFIETACDKGRHHNYQPSGITTTTADVWAFVIADTGIAVLVPTDHVRMMLDHVTTRDADGADDDSCPTRGKLINLGALLYEYKKRYPRGRPCSRA